VDTLEGSGPLSSIGGIKWGCFLCAHPEKAMGFLRGKLQQIIYDFLLKNVFFSKVRKE